MGVPVFLADVKGDLSGLSQPMKMNDKVQKRLDQIGIDDYQLAGYPLVFWDLLQELVFQCAPRLVRWVLSCWLACWN